MHLPKFETLSPRQLLSVSCGPDNLGATSTAAAITLAASTSVATPANFAVATNEAGTVTLTWTGTTINQGVRIQRSMDAGITFTTLAEIAGNNFTYTDSSVLRSTPYTYRIQAYTSSSNASEFTTPLSITTGPAAVASLLKTAVTTTSVSLSWTAVPGATGYKLEQSKEGGPFTTVLEPAAGTTTATVDNLDPGTLYAYRIRATNSGGASPTTNLSGALTISPPPTNLTVGVTSAGIKLEFEPSKGAASYVVERSSTGRAFQKLVDLDKFQTTYTDILTPESDTYKYRVKAVSEAGDSSFSNIAAVSTTAEGELPVADSLKASAGDKNTTLLSFNGPTTSNYRVERFLSGVWKPFAVVPAGSTSASLKGLKVGTTTQVRVVATAGAEAGIPSDSIPVTPVPAAIKKIGLLKTTGPGSVGLVWSASPGTEKYRVERSSNGGKTWDNLSEASATAYVDENIQDGTTYQYRVSAGNDTGYSLPSKPFIVTTPPPTPEDLELTDAVLSWSDVDGETGYTIEGSTDGITWKKAATAKADATSLTLKLGAFSFYRIIATSKSGNSAPSDFVTASTDDLSTRGFSSSLIHL